MDFDLLSLILCVYAFTVLVFLAIIAYQLYFWMGEHATLMSILSHSVQEIKKKIK